MARLRRNLPPKTMESYWSRLGYKDPLEKTSAKIRKELNQFIIPFLGEARYHESNSPVVKALALEFCKTNDRANEYWPVQRSVGATPGPTWLSRQKSILENLANIISLKSYNKQKNGPEAIQRSNKNLTESAVGAPSMMGDVTAPSASGSSATTTPSAVPIDASTEVPPQSRPFETVETISPKSHEIGHKRNYIKHIESLNPKGNDECGKNLTKAWLSAPNAVWTQNLDDALTVIMHDRNVYYPMEEDTKIFAVTRDLREGTELGGLNDGSQYAEFASRVIARTEIISNQLFEQHIIEYDASSNIHKTKMFADLWKDHQDRWNISASARRESSKDIFDISDSGSMPERRRPSGVTKKHSPRGPASPMVASKKPQRSPNRRRADESFDGDRDTNIISNKRQKAIRLNAVPKMVEPHLIQSSTDSAQTPDTEMRDSQRECSMDSFDSLFQEIPKSIYVAKKSGPSESCSGTPKQKPSRQAVSASPPLSGISDKAGDQPAMPPTPEIRKSIHSGALGSLACRTATVRQTTEDSDPESSHTLSQDSQRSHLPTSSPGQSRPLSPGLFVTPAPDILTSFSDLASKFQQPQSASVRPLPATSKLAGDSLPTITRNGPQTIPLKSIAIDTTSITKSTLPIIAKTSSNPRSSTVFRSPAKTARLFSKSFSGNTTKSQNSTEPSYLMEVSKSSSATIPTSNAPSPTNNTSCIPAMTQNQSNSPTLRPQAPSPATISHETSPLHFTFSSPLKSITLPTFLLFFALRSRISLPLLSTVSFTYGLSSPTGGEMFNGTLEQLYHKLLGKDWLGEGIEVLVFVDEEKLKEKSEGETGIQKGKGKESENATTGPKGSEIQTPER